MTPIPQMPLTTTKSEKAATSFFKRSFPLFLSGICAVSASSAFAQNDARWIIPANVLSSAAFTSETTQCSIPPLRQ